MTAAEAAATLCSSGQHGGAGDAAADDGPCAADDDCTFTRIAPGACCPMLCTPRAVTKKGAEAAEAHMKTCARGHECPQPMCRPPRELTIPACVQSRCVAKVRDEKGVQ
jgi:hypothetical protein